MNRIITFVKQWTLLCSLIVGTVIYLLFSRISFLMPIGDFMGPKLTEVMPAVIFCILYVTFCKIQIHDLKPRTWHFILQIIRTSLAALMVGVLAFTHNPEFRLIFEGMFVCFICPTAAAAAVVTDKLGGSIASMTVYLLIANAFTAIIIPTFFPLVERGSGLTFTMAFLMVLQRVLTVLVAPLLLAFLTRKFLPKLAGWLKRQKNLAFYLWSFNLSIVMGLAVQSLTSAPVSGHTLFLLCTIPLLICILQFTIGKAVGAHWGDSITAGQALGQKNTVVGIWLTLSFLNPYAAISPCSYVIWQNIVNAIQLYIKEKTGKLK